MAKNSQGGWNLWVVLGVLIVIAIIAALLYDSVPGA